MAYSILFGNEDEEKEKTEDERHKEMVDRKFYDDIERYSFDLCGSLNQLHGYLDGMNLIHPDSKAAIIKFLRKAEAKEVGKGNLS